VENHKTVGTLLLHNDGDKPLDFFMSDGCLDTIPFADIRNIFLTKVDTDKQVVSTISIA